MYIPNELFKIKDLNMCDICILGLINNCNCEEIYLPQETIRKKIGYSLKLISLSLNKLVKLGYIDYIIIPNKRYKLIRTTDIFYKFFKKRADCKKSYRDKKTIAPKFKKLKNNIEMSEEEMNDAKRLCAELLGKQAGFNK